jgi:hypothetical protein
MIYVSFLFSYVIPLLKDWNFETSNKPLEYPFANTSSKKTSRSKGLFLLISSSIFVILLFICLLRTIFSDPGFFPSPLDLEYQVVLRNLKNEEEVKLKEKDEEEEEIINECEKDEEILVESSDKDFENFEFKKNFFKVDFKSKKKENKPKTLEEHNNTNKNKENNFEIYENQSLNLINFTKKISDIPLCYEEYNKTADFLENWNYKIQEKDNFEKDPCLENTLISNGYSESKIKEDTNLNFFDVKNRGNFIKEKKSKNSEENTFQNPEVFNGYVGYDVGKTFLCGSCVRMKVERSHHCKQCGKCVLKMDHHCPWLANCIGYKNYKFFLLTHLHGMISSSIIVFSYWETFINALSNNSISIIVLSWHMFVYVCNLGLFAFLLWLFWINWTLMFQGLTVIENADRERFPSANFKNNYDLGYYRNFKVVFGENPFFWFLPIFFNDKYNGIYFEKNDIKQDRLMMLI